MNVREKRMLNLEIAKLLNTKLIRGDHNIFEFMQFHENGKYQDVSLSKEAQHVLSLINNIDTNNKTLQ